MSVMEEFIATWGTAMREVSLGGFAVYALVNVWKRLLEMANQHRLDSQAKDAGHRDELKERDDRHRQETRELIDKHQHEMAEVVSRNMDEHRERNRVQTKLAMAVAVAFSEHGIATPDPYPDVDEHGRKDPRG